LIVNEVRSERFIFLAIQTRNHSINQRTGKWRGLRASVFDRCNPNPDGLSTNFQGLVSKDPKNGHVSHAASGGYQLGQLLVRPVPSYAYLVVGIRKIRLAAASGTNTRFGNALNFE
jgi:hypothetical protein